MRWLTCKASDSSLTFFGNVVNTMYSACKCNMIKRLSILLIRSHDSNDDSLSY